MYEISVSGTPKMSNTNILGAMLFVCKMVLSLCSFLFKLQTSIKYNFPDMLTNEEVVKWVH